MRNPTTLELARFAWSLRLNRRSATAREIEAMMAGQAKYLRVLQGRPPAPPPPDPDRCPCGHSYGLRHTNRPRGYGCCDCLCLSVP